MLCKRYLHGNREEDDIEARSQNRPIAIACIGCLDGAALGRYQALGKRQPYPDAGRVGRGRLTGILAAVEAFEHMGKVFWRNTRTSILYADPARKRVMGHAYLDAAALCRVLHAVLHHV